MLSLLGNTQYKITKRAIILALFFIGIFFFTIPNPKQYVYGMVFGTTINLLNFRLMSLTLAKSVNLPQSKIIPYVVGNYFARYIIYGTVLAIAAIADYISFYTTIFGIFMVKIIIISDTFYDMIKHKKKNNKKESNEGR